MAVRVGLCYCWPVPCPCDTTWRKWLSVPSLPYDTPDEVFAVRHMTPSYTLWRITPCHVTTCHMTHCYMTPCHMTPCNMTPLTKCLQSATRHPVIWHPALWHPSILQPATWHPATWHTVTWHPAIWHPIIWHPAAWHPATRHPARCHPATWHPAIWHPATWHPALWHPATWRAWRSVCSVSVRSEDWDDLLEVGFLRQTQEKPSGNKWTFPVGWTHLRDSFWTELYVQHKLLGGERFDFGLNSALLFFSKTPQCSARPCLTYFSG